MPVFYKLENHEVYVVGDLQDSHTSKLMTRLANCYEEYFWYFVQTPEKGAK